MNVLTVAEKRFFTAILIMFLIVGGYAYKTWGKSIGEFISDARALGVQTASVLHTKPWDEEQRKEVAAMLALGRYCTRPAKEDEAMCLSWFYVEPVTWRSWWGIPLDELELQARKMFFDAGLHKALLEQGRL